MTIEQPSTSFVDGAGHPKPQWTIFANSVWMEIEELSASETVRGDQLQVVKTGTARCRYLPGLAAEMRICWGGRNLNIDSVISDPKLREQTVTWGESV